MTLEDGCLGAVAMTTGESKTGVFIAVRGPAGTEQNAVDFVGGYLSVISWVQEAG